MPADGSEEVTRILQTAADDREAATKLLPLVYDELRSLARARLANLTPGQTLQPTALVHEAYIRLLHNAELPGANRAQFFLVASRAMRRILINHARDRTSIIGIPYRVASNTGAYYRNREVAGKFLRVANSTVFKVGLEFGFIEVLANEY